MVYVGLPVILYSLAQTSPTRSLEIESLAVLAIAPLIPVYNLTAVIVLLIGRKSGENPGAQIRKLVINVFTNPMLLACAAGIAYLLTGWELPVAVGRSCSLVGQMALPMALVTTGASLTFKSLKGGLQETVIGSLIKVVVAPLVGYWIGSGLGLAKPDLQIALIFCACPSAVVGFVMAEQLGADYRLTGNMILLTTFLAMPGLALVLLLSGA
jgi:predicted permease